MSKLFIPYIMGNLNFIHNLKKLSDDGADIVEIGVPFSDPVADGPIIMSVGHRAIKEGVNVDYIFNQLEANKQNIYSKYILMTYFNIICSYGEKEFLDRCIQLLNKQKDLYTQ